MDNGSNTHHKPDTDHRAPATSPTPPPPPPRPLHPHPVHLTIIRLVQRGGVVVIKDFLSPTELSSLRADAMALHRDDTFIVDGLSNYGKKEKVR